MPAVPQFCPSPRELDDLELLVTGALVPTVVFNEPGSPVTLELPESIAELAAKAGAVEIVDPEGLPLAEVELPAGTIDPLTHTQYGPFRRLYLSPTETRERYAGRTFVPLVDALTVPQLAALATVGPVVLLPLVGHGTPELSTVGLIRATLAAADHLPDAAVVAIPLASHGDPDVDHDLGVQVVGNYAAGDPVVGVSEDPTGAFSPEIAAIVETDRPAPDEQGLVLFFTGLSGSGKSTLARALTDRLLEQGTRSVTSLDGDVVRRNLSAGLTFSKEDRETNIRRIGWVAAEISRHRGVAVCSPIAPFAETRRQVRAMVEEAGGAFFLVHVATPLAECERRDRKGMYAKARRGEIPEFTGISSPYEEPADADVRVDTTGRTIEEALDDVLVALRDSGYLDLTTEPVADDGSQARVPKPPAVAEVVASIIEKQPTHVPKKVAEASASVVEEGALAPVSKPPKPDTEPSAPVVEEGALAPVSKPPKPDSEPSAPVVEEVAQPSPPVFEEVAQPSPPVFEEVAQPSPPVVEEVAQPSPPVVEEVAQPSPPVVEEVAQQPSRNHPTPGRAASASERAETTADGSVTGDHAKHERPLRVLFVCTANICRSPFMELSSRHLVGPDAHVTFASSGTHGAAGSEMSPDMAATLASRGVTGGHSFRSRPFKTEQLLHADLVLTAENAHRTFILDDHPGAFRKVFTLGQFAEAVRNSATDVTGRDLLAAVGTRRGTADPSLDIPDPYGQGPEAAEAAASAIEDLLRVVLPALTGSRKITA
ncbi:MULTISPECIES: adenylyl-sulfate kinase [unclassified Nocardioides]|uniref:adenylyl-sulfate kinase n=1 Tax=unclassified Nocardioides TaxID=2615069 RepID=UPI0009F07A8C|nr:MULTISPECIES: adenylyl-sulfate kinase [unclassified Nocardioides]GAW48469.1 Adenylylsulfate kinase [Nocardioides sp. PD653-B2]GAW52796.1 Adenylylsulfate kinase [Nocardioides sp. PD653]